MRSQARRRPLEKRSRKRPSDRVRVFVSYSRDDEVIVSILVDVLRVGLPRVFRDVESLQPGDEWRPRIVRAISNCDVFALFWSRSASQSEGVRSEWTQAVTQQKRIVPVLLDSTPLTKSLAAHQWVDVRALTLEHDPNIHHFLEPTHLAGQQLRRAMWRILRDEPLGEVVASSWLTVKAIRID